MKRLLAAALFVTTLLTTPGHTADITNPGGSPTGAAGGGLTGSYPNPTVATNANMTGDVTSVGNATTLAAGNAGNLNLGTLPAARLPSSPIVNSLAGAVTLNNTGTFFDGPSVAQGSTGTWFASGTVTLIDTTGAATFQCELWDGTTVIASGSTRSVATTVSTILSLSGFLASPAGNLRISCEDATSTSGQIQSNASGKSKDSTISAYRIN